MAIMLTKIEKKVLKKLSTKKCQKDMENLINNGFLNGKTIADVIIDVSKYQNNILKEIENEKAIKNG